MKKLLMVFIATVCLSTTGCISTERDISDTGIFSDPTAPESADNTLLSERLSDSFMSYWEGLEDHSLVGSAVEVFTFEGFKEYDKTVFFVYPEYKTCRAVIYGVNCGEIELIGDISCGFEFAYAADGTLRTAKTLASLHSTETIYTYYNISEGTEATLSVSELSGEEDTVYGRFVNGENVTIGKSEYDSLRKSADSGLDGAVFVDLDADGDFRLDGGCIDSESLAEYILERLGAQK